MRNLILLSIISMMSLQLLAQSNLTESNMDTMRWDTISFETPYEYLSIDTSNQNIWQIGKPDKMFFNNAYTPINAIVTDTVNFYPQSNTSYFDIKIGDFNYPDYYPYSIYIEMKHKFDTDTLKDGGFITVSYDGGGTWYNIINSSGSGYWSTTPTNDGDGGDNLYTEADTLFNGEYGFSGNSNDWINTWFAWYVLPVNNSESFIEDTMLVRFNFISDSINNNREGWMIDDIKLYSIDLGSGIEEIPSLNFTITPNPMHQVAYIELDRYHEVDLSIFDVQGQLVRQKHYSNNQSVIINRKELNAGVYFIKIRADGKSVGMKKLVIK